MKSTSQSGFSLIELMFASAGALIIVAAVAKLLLNAADWSSTIRSQTAVNRHARLAFEVLLNGAQAASAGSDGTRNIYALDGLHTAPNKPYRSSYAFTYTSNNKTVTPDSFSPLTVTCTATGVPLPDCGSSGTKTVSGWMGNDAAIERNKRVIANRTFEITLTVTNPFEASRVGNTTAATTTYRTVSTLIRDEADP